VSRLFDAYVMVDWSAAQAPKSGKDGVWIGVIKRDIRFRPTFEAHNPETRAKAEAQLRTVLADLRRRSEKALIGFGFPLGFPEGTAAALKLKSESWTGLWDFLGANVVDKADNTNNRFAVAAKVNRLMTDEARPFWGSPPKDAQRWLASTKPAEHGQDLPPLLRRTEAATASLGKAAAKGVWQLMGAGASGPQALTGIPAVRRLKTELGDKSLVWPFETGWRALKPEDVDGMEAVIAEVYPPSVPPKPEPGEAPDRAQVRALCEHFAKLDDAGKLAAAFGPPKGMDDTAVKAVEAEEGWMLGL
jgi:hypothetical protein